MQKSTVRAQMQAPLSMLTITAKFCFQEILHDALYFYLYRCLDSDIPLYPEGTMRYDTRSVTFRRIRINLFIFPFGHTEFLTLVIASMDMHVGVVSSSSVAQLPSLYIFLTAEAIL